MATSGIYTDFIRLRGKSDDSKQSGLTVALLPDGGSAPGGLILLSQDAGTTWQYNFDSQIVNGRYTLYINGVPAQNNGSNIEIYVMRNQVTAGDTDFAYE